jgi:hypothetical protein
VSAGVYALIGVIVGGLLSFGGQVALTWWQAKKAGEAEWVVANRLISDELERLMRDLDDLLQEGKVPLNRRDDFLSTSLWEELRSNDRPSAPKRPRRSGTRRVLEGPLADLRQRA